jgi:hypothetical protein
VRRKLQAAVLGLVAAVGLLIAPSAPAIAEAPQKAAAEPGEMGVAAVPFGWYRIRIMAGGDCLQADPFNADFPDRHTRVFLAPCDGSVYQRWAFGPTAVGYPAQYREIRNGSGRCLDAENRGGRLTHIIHIYACNLSRNQAWAFADPGSSSVGCVYVAHLCDWRPTMAGPWYPAGLPVYLDQTTAGGNFREWRVEAI